MYVRFPGGKLKALTLSYDDGVEQDERLLKLMETHGVKGAFNIDSGRFAPEGTVYEPGRVHRPMTEAKCKKLYASPCAELSCHTVTHPYLTKLPLTQVMKEVAEDRANLERMSGQIVRGMAYPFGDYNDAVVEILRAAGIAYCRTVISTEDFRLPADPLRLTATCHHNNPRLMELADRFVDTQPRNAPYCDPWLFYLWGHSYEFEANDNWPVIEKFLDRVAGQEDVWYATNIEIIDYLAAYRSLLWGAEGDLCTNPTSTDVWVQKDSACVCVKAGQTVCF